MKTLIADSKLVAKLMPARSSRSKKGDNGIVLVVGGSRIYHGAPLLASLAAMRSGADLAYVAVPKSISVAVRSHSPSIIVLPLPDDRLTAGSVNKLKAMLPKKVDAAAIGMGMSVAKSSALTNLIGELNAMNAKILLDASALIPDALSSVSKRQAVLTPHAGEFKRVFQQDPGKSETERLKNVKELAAKHNVTVLLKGWIDVISDGDKVAVNKTHNCAMTVGGTGDVLSGLVAGLLAKGMNPFDASVAGAYINGAAGDRAYRRIGLHMMPTDIVDEIPAVMKIFDSIKKQ
ncbi:MAG: NAD(P)H-hydrate dehydratase [Nitrososphaerales archaeon]